MTQPSPRIAAHTDPALVEFAVWNAAVSGPHDRLVLLAIERWRRLWDEVTPSAAYIAGELGVSTDTVRRTCKRLAQRGLIVVTARRKGDKQGTNAYALNVEALISAVPDERREVLARLVNPESLTASLDPTQSRSQPVCQSRSQPPKTKTRETQETKNTCALAAEIYSAYPRKVGRRAAITEIEHAILRVATSDRTTPEVAASVLLAITQRFAASPAGQAGQYTPHPRTWFRQERYTDDPSEWTRTDDRQASGGSGGDLARRAAAQWDEPERTLRIAT